MEPFFFGPDERLFGIYHAPRSPDSDRAAAVLCSPVGQEYIRSHRSFSLLARKLAIAGVDTLQFDYRGCGDSPGDWADWGIDHWVEDVRTAVDELRRGIAGGPVHLIGLRLGATLAAFGAIECPEVAGLVLWDPVVDGRQHLAELLDRQERWLQQSFAVADRAATPPSIAHESLGFPLTSGFCRELAAASLLGLRSRPAPRTLIVETGGSTAEARALLERLESLDAGPVCERSDDQPVWLKQGDGLETAVVPVRVLARVVDWIETSFRAPS